MKAPVVHSLTRNEFEKAESIYKIVSDDITNTHVYFELNSKKYYIGYPSSDIIQVELKVLEKEDYLLVGVDLKVVVLCMKTGRILLALGLFSYFKGFEDTNDLAFTIFSELEDIKVNKNSMSISQITFHDLEL